MTARMVPAAAEIHRQVNPESRSARMGPSYCAAFLGWFLREEHGTVALAALDGDGRIVGYAVGAPLGYAAISSRHLAWSAAAAVLRRPWVVFARRFRRGLPGRLRVLFGRPADTDAVPRVPQPAMSLVAMGVVESARRMGVGTALVAAFESKALERRMRSVRLSTRADNVSARRFYERCGWKPLARTGEQAYYVRVLSER